MFLVSVFGLPQEGGIGSGRLGGTERGVQRCEVNLMDATGAPGLESFSQAEALLCSQPHIHSGTVLHPDQVDANVPRMNAWPDLFIVRSLCDRLDREVARQRHLQLRAEQKPPRLGQKSPTPARPPLDPEDVRIPGRPNFVPWYL